MVGRRRFWHFRGIIRDESGSATIWSLGMTVLFLLVGGLAIDVGNAFRVRHLLQTTADSAAHAGVQDVTTEAAAETLAVSFAEANMPSASFGTVLEPANILVGTWNANTRIFTQTMADPDAVRVMTQQTEASGNPVATFFLKLANFQLWNIGTTATAQQFYRKCHHDGMLAGGVVQIASNNSFVDFYCIHGEQGVQVSSNNSFETGVSVSMYDLGDFQMPGSGFATNAGLQQALSEDFIQPTLANQAASIAAALANPSSIYQPSYIDASRPVISHARSRFNSANLQQNRVNTVSCSGNQQVTVNRDLTNVVLASSGCRINFGNGITLVNSVIATTNATGGSVTGSHVQFGADDNCAAGGGTQVISAGGVNISGDSEYYGSQIISGQNIHISAQNNGIEGSSFQAAGNIQETSLGAFGLCNGGADVIAKVISYRIVD